MRHFLAAIMIGLAGSSASAGSVTVEFDAEITGFINDGVDVESAFSLGQTITGTFTYDDTVLDSSSTGNTGRFENAITAFSLNTSGYTITQNGGTSRISTANNSALNSVSGDYFIGSVSDPTAADVDGAPINGVGFSFIDTNSTLFASNSEAKSLTPTYDFSAFDLPSGTGIDLRWDYVLVVGFDPIENEPISDFGQVQAEITRVAIIPEPSSLALLGVGGLLVARRRRYS